MAGSEQIDVPTGASRSAQVAELADVGRDDVSLVGGKAANLGELIRAGLPVPAGFVVTTAAYRAFVAANDLQDRIIGLVPAVGAGTGAYEMAAEQIAALFAAGELPQGLAVEIGDAQRRLGDEPVAVRSSATAEDLASASFAGQQDSYLNITGAKPLLAAVRRCWGSLWSARAMAYRARQRTDPADVSLAVVVQPLVDAESAGVMFTADPRTGRRDAVLIGAAWGLGEAVVGGLVNTDQLTLGPELRIEGRQTADKQVQTVRTADGTTEVEVPAERRHAPVLDDGAARELAGLGRRIAEHFDSPQDIEWVRDGHGRLLIVQSRPITALPAVSAGEAADAGPSDAGPSDPGPSDAGSSDAGSSDAGPTGPVPTSWPVPDVHARYFRASIVEQLPDPLTPLFAELIEPAVTQSLRALMDDVLGPGAVGPGDVGLPTINGYAYYRYANSAMTRMLRGTPTALRGAYGKKGFGGRERWETVAQPTYQTVVDAWTQRALFGLSATQLLDGVAELVTAGAVYYTSVQTIIPLAATSETALTRYYDAFIRRGGDPPAAALLLGFDSEPIRAERSLWDLAHWAQGDDQLASWLGSASATEIVAALDAPSEAPVGVTEFAVRFGEHLAEYGHAVYNLDFAHPVAGDDPATLIDTIRLALAGRLADPYERQRRLQQKRDAATMVIRRRIDPVRRGQFDWLLRKAQAIAPIREDALADVGLAWPQLRRMLAELGRRLMAAGVVDTADDVFWCRRAEIADVLTAESRAEAAGDRPDLRAVVAQRRQIWRGQRLATPPQWLPQGTWMDRLGALMPATDAEQTGDRLSGSGASGGRITGTARVLSGPADFGRLQPGDVLVASVTTPAWTSLFARASAVVTDIGGPLSHSSIVAREYGIPAVLGTAVATRRIVDGQQVTVDGDAGVVHLSDPGTELARPEHRRLNRWLIAGGIAAAAVGGTTAVGALIRRRPS